LDSNPVQCEVSLILTIITNDKTMTTMITNHMKTVAELIS